MMHCLSTLALFVVALIYSVSALDNEFDTYNAEECKRVRRPWHKLSEEEQQLYMDGLIELRAKSQGNVDLDELLAIGSVHQDETKNTHRTSSYFFWHGYILWELESRIRNLGGKWKCFAMPYWDFARESGREHDPEILTSKALGGNGDPENAWNVNGFSWDVSVKDYWIPQNCVAEGDEYPYCSLKRSLREELEMPSAKALADTIIHKHNFVDFADYVMQSSAGIHLLDDHGRDIGDNWQGFPQAYEPIWYLYHSGIQFHQALWTDCHDYDLIPPEELDDHPDAFSTYCFTIMDRQATCNTKSLPKDSVWYGEKFDLDEAMPFGGSLPDQEWAYINKNDLSPRDCYHLPRWNIIYELRDEEEDSFWQVSGMNHFCENYINDEWFITDAKRLNKQDAVEESESQLDANTMMNMIRVDSNNMWMMMFVAIPVVLMMFIWWYRKSSESSKNQSLLESIDSIAYGASD